MRVVLVTDVHEALLARGLSYRDRRAGCGHVTRCRPGPVGRACASSGTGAVRLQLVAATRGELR